MTAPALPPVFVVDDSEDDLDLIKRLLAKSRVKNPVVTFDDAKAAIAFLKAAPSSPEPGLMPCLLLTDLKMPELDGFELIKWIRGQKRFARLPVIMMSSGGAERDAKEAKAAGADRFLAKFPTAEETP